MRCVKVGGILGEIKFFQDKRLVPTEGSDEGPLLGECNGGTHTIHLFDSPIPGELEVTFYHELMHAIVGAYHIRSIRNKDGTHNEDSIDTLAIGLQEALSSLGVNIVAYLKESK